MRLFIAINFNEEVKKRIWDNIQRLKKLSKKGSFTLRENLHLTLAFIGETDKLEQVRGAMDRTVDSINLGPFYLSLSTPGKFERKEGDIYWLGVKKEEALWMLQARLTDELRGAGFNIESRSYKPHITLGRRVILKEEDSIKELKENSERIEVAVEGISLMRSDRIGGKLVYTDIHRRSLEN